MRSGGHRVYLAYGSNLHPRRLAARLGPVDLVGVVALPGWSLRFNKRGGDGSAKANLQPVPGSACKAWAAAYSLRIDQIRKLDVFEGCGHGYETVDMSIMLNEKARHAFTYLVPSQWITQTLLPFDWYVDLIVAGARFHELDQAFMRQLLQQPACRDEDAERARRELSGTGLPIPRHYLTRQP